MLGIAINYLTNFSKFYIALEADNSFHSEIYLKNSQWLVAEESFNFFFSAALHQLSDYRIFGGNTF